jgi:GNAT superfamily N-acetyltransferase
VLTFGYSLEHGGRDGLIDELYVCAQERSLGIGTALIEAASACCRGLGIWRVHLEVDHTNPRAERLYLELGFRANDRQLLTRKLGP